MQDRPGIYKITNHIDGRSYIGSSISVKKGVYCHLWYLKKGKHQNAFLQRAWNKYGEGSFRTRVLLYCSKEDLLVEEQRIIDGGSNLYNICKTAGNSLGRKCSEETREKLRVAGLNQKGRVGCKHSEKTRAILSKRMTEWWKTPDGIKKKQTQLLNFE